MATDAGGRFDPIDLIRAVGGRHNPDLLPDLRLESYTYQQMFGHPPAVFWHVPGTVTLLSNARQRLTVAARWGAKVAAEPRCDGLVEPIFLYGPGEPALLTVEEAAAGAGPAYAREGLRSARQGATLLINTDLPPGSGLAASEAIQAAVRLALQDVAAAGDSAADPDQADDGDDEDVGHYAVGTALLGGRQLPFDLAAAGLRLVTIDTRVRDVPQPPATEHSPMEAAAAALEAGEIEALGPMMTAAHTALAPDEVQDVAVASALEAGALGARMVIDGPGRPVCALVRAAGLADVRAGICRAFAVRGWRTPRFLTVAPAAHRPRRVA
jgi:galactokinase